jgi:DNA excision repair protein ERCC-2
MNFNRKTLEVAGQNLRDLENKIAEEKEIGKTRLEEEYKSLVHRLANKKVITSEQEMLSNPILQQEVTVESIPGNIRKATHFLPVLRKLIVYFKDLLNSRELIMESPLNLVYKLQEKYYIDQRTLKFTAQRLHILMNTLQIANIDQYSSLNVVANMATLISTYYKGFVVIIEPYPEDQLLHDPRL